MSYYSEVAIMAQKDIYEIMKKTWEEDNLHPIIDAYSKDYEAMCIFIVDINNFAQWSRLYRLLKELETDEKYSGKNGYAFRSIIGSETSNYNIIENDLGAELFDDFTPLMRYSFPKDIGYHPDESDNLLPLPVPLGTTLYFPVTSCGDFCTFQPDLFSKQSNNIYVKEQHNCNRECACHTRLDSVQSLKFTLTNIEFVLENYGTWLFKTEEEAFSQGNTVIEEHQKKMKELGFHISENGYSSIM